MKFTRAFLIICCLSILLTSFSYAVLALEQDEARVSIMWSNQTPFKGSNVNLNIFFINDTPDTLTLFYIGLNFDWMEPDDFIGLNLLNDPVVITGNDGYNFGPINIPIPENATTGLHSYYVGVEGLRGDSIDFTWDSMLYTLQIQPSAEGAYSELASQVDMGIIEANNNQYRSSDARAFVEQAEDSYDQAISLAEQENWEVAITELQKASTYLEQAELEEQNYEETESQQFPLLLVVVVVVVAGIVIIIVVLVFRRRRKQATSVDEPVQNESHV